MILRIVIGVRRTPLSTRYSVRRTLVNAKEHIIDRERLNQRRVLETAVQLADSVGIDAVSMRRLATELNVVPMALYKHVANKEELLDGMVDVIIAEIPQPQRDGGWKVAARDRVLGARSALQRHPWARAVIETRTTTSTEVLSYMNSFAGIFLDGGFSPDLAHHCLHAIGGRMWGFTQELFQTPDAAPAPSPQQLEFMASRFPHILTVAGGAAHDPRSAVGAGCDDQFEFEFALDLLLDGFERLHAAGWTSGSVRDTQ